MAGGLFELTGEFGPFQVLCGFISAIVISIGLGDSAATTFFFHDIPHRSVYQAIYEVATSGVVYHTASLYF